MSLRAMGIATLVFCGVMAACFGSSAPDDEWADRRSLSMGPIVSPVFRLDPLILSTEFSSAAGECSISAGAGQYLVAQERGSCLRVNRIALDGGFIEPGGFCADGQFTWQSRQSASAWDGQEWLLVWRDGNIVRAVRISGDGQVLDAIPEVVATNAYDAEPPDVAFNGTDFLVTWTTAPDVNNGLGVQAVRVRTDGHIVGAPIGIAPLASSAAVAADGAQFLVVYLKLGQNGRTEATRVSGDGSVLDTPPLVLSSTPYLNPPDVVFDGTYFIAAWSSYEGQIFARRVSSDGCLAETMNLGLPGSKIAMASAGGVTTVATTSVNQVYERRWFAAQLNADGIVTQRLSSELLIGTAEVEAIAALPGHAMLLRFELLPIPIATLSYDGPVLLGESLFSSPPLTRGSPFVIQTMVNSETQPALASTQQQVLVTWRDGRGTNRPSSQERVAGVLFSQSPPGGVETPVTLSLDGGNSRVATNGADFLVSWQSGADVFVGRVLRDAGVPDFPGKPIGMGSVGDVVWGFNEYVVLWASAGSVQATRIAPSATLGGVQVVASAATPLSNVRGAREDADVLAVWQQGSPSGVQGARLWADGGVSPSFTVASGSLVLPAVASDGTASLVVWQDIGSGVPRIGASLGSADGGWSIVSPTFWIPAADAGQSSARVTFDGVNFLVVWMQESPEGQRLLSARFDPTGHVVDATPVPLDFDGGVLSFSVGSVSAQRTLVVRSHFDSRLLTARVTGQYVNQSGCELDSECMTASECRVGVCNQFTASCGMANAPDFTPCLGVDAGGCLGGICVPRGAFADAGLAADSGSSFDAGLRHDGGVAVHMDAGFVCRGVQIVDAGAATDAGQLVDAGIFVDAGVLVDAGISVDAGVLVDAGMSVDAGGFADGGDSVDAGDVADGGGSGDAGQPLDAGPTTDSGVSLDAGYVFDAGVMPSDGGQFPDAGVSPDSGFPLDAGDSDGGLNGADAGMADGGTAGTLSRGCGCQGASDIHCVGLLLAIALIRRRPSAADSLRLRPFP